MLETWHGRSGKIGAVAVAVVGAASLPVLIAGWGWVFAPTPPSSDALAVLAFLGLAFGGPLTAFVVIGAAVGLATPVHAPQKIALGTIATLAALARAAVSAGF